MTIYVYEYDKVAGEYLNKKVAEADPEETKKAGRFVPLVPGYATLIKPPEVDNRHVAVFINGAWRDKLDYRNFFTVNEDLTVNKIATIDKPNGVIVDSVMAGKISSNRDDYKIVDNEVVEKTQEDKEKERKEKLALLSLTKREVFLAVYKAKQITPQMIREQITDPEALIEFDYATQYFRGNPLINEIGEKLGYSSDDLDYLFENGTLPSKEE